MQTAAGQAMTASERAAQLGIVREAVDLYRDCDVIDLHLDSFIWARAAGYDLRRAHDRGLFGGRLYSHADFPRALEAGLTAATWVITTQPWRGARGRRQAFFANHARLSAMLDEQPGIRRVGDLQGYLRARQAGEQAAFMGIQGGNALEYDLADIERLKPEDLLRVTLLHGTRSGLGAPSSQGFQRGQGLTDRGREMVERLVQARVFVDLAHISERGFWDAVQVHPRDVPLLVSHTGVSGVRPMWRNISDAQLHAVARTGGVVGVIFHSFYLGDPLLGGVIETVVDHIQHIVDVVGEDVPAIGSDFDGLICPPRDLCDVRHMPRLVDAMLRRGMGDGLIRKVLGANFLGALRRLRG